MVGRFSSSMKAICVCCHACQVALERRLSSEVDIDDTSKKSIVKPARISSQSGTNNLSKDNDSDSDVDVDSEPEEISRDENVANMEFQENMLIPLITRLTTPMKELKTFLQTKITVIQQILFLRIRQLQLNQVSL